MFSVSELVCGVLLPLALGLLLTEIGRDLRTDGVRRGLSGLAIIVAVALSHLAVALSMDARLVPPLLGWHWLPWACLAPLALLSCACLPRWIQAALTATIAAAGVILLLRPMCLSMGWVTISLWAAVAAVSAITTCMAAEWQRSRNLPARPISEHLAALAASGAIALGTGLTGSKDLAVLAGMVPLALIGSAVVHACFRLIPEGLALVVAVLGTWHVAIASNYSEMPWWSALALAIPYPLGWWASVCFGRSARSQAWWQIAVTGGLALLGVLLAATLAQPPPSDGPGYGY